MIIKVSEEYRQVRELLEEAVYEELLWLKDFLEKDITKRVFLQGVIKTIQNDLQLTSFSSGNDVIVEISVPYLLAGQLSTNTEFGLSYWSLFRPFIFQHCNDLYFSLIGVSGFRKPLSEMLKNAIHKILLAARYNLTKEKLAFKRKIKAILPDLLRSTYMELETTDRGKKTIEALNVLVDQGYTIDEAIALIIYMTRSTIQKDEEYNKILALELFALTEALEKELITDDGFNKQKIKTLIFNPHQYITKEEKVQRALDQLLSEIAETKVVTVKVNPLISELKETILKRKKAEETTEKESKE